MAQHIAALEILPVRSFLQHQILREVVAVVAHMQACCENGLTTAWTKSAGCAGRLRAAV